MVLQISPTATEAEIKHAYWDLSLKYHPQYNQDPGAAETFAQVEQAFQVLRSLGNQVQQAHPFSASKRPPQTPERPTSVQSPPSPRSSRPEPASPQHAHNNPMYLVEEKDHYRVLQIYPSASPEELKKAYHSMAKLFHPDNNKGDGAAAIFQRVNDAYHVLSDAEARLKYDEKRAPQEPPKRSSPSKTNSPFHSSQSSSMHWEGDDVAHRAKTWAEEGRGRPMPKEMQFDYSQYQEYEAGPCHGVYPEGEDQPRMYQDSGVWSDVRPSMRRGMGRDGPAEPQPADPWLNDRVSRSPDGPTMRMGKKFKPQPKAPSMSRPTKGAPRPKSSKVSWCDDGPTARAASWDVAGRSGNQQQNDPFHYTGPEVPKGKFNRSKSSGPRPKFSSPSTVAAKVDLRNSRPTSFSSRNKVSWSDEGPTARAASWSGAGRPTPSNQQQQPPKATSQPQPQQYQQPPQMRQPKYQQPQAAQRYNQNPRPKGASRGGIADRVIQQKQQQQYRQAPQNVRGGIADRAIQQKQQQQYRQAPQNVGVPQGRRGTPPASRASRGVSWSDEGPSARAASWSAQGRPAPQPQYQKPQPSRSTGSGPMGSSRGGIADRVRQAQQQRSNPAGQRYGGMGSPKQAPSSRGTKPSSSRSQFTGKRGSSVTWSQAR